MPTFLVMIRRHSSSSASWFSTRRCCSRSSSRRSCSFPGPSRTSWAKRRIFASGIPDARSLMPIRSSASRPVMNLTIALDLESTLDFTVGSVTTPTVAHQQVVPDRRRRLLILGICSMSLLIVGLDATIVTVALPAIQRSFHSTLSGLQWTIDAYTLVLASLLMLSGSTADRLGRRRVFQAGLALFSLGSLLCALAPSLELLVAFRVVQATGGAMLTPVAMSIVRNVFEDPRERAQAIGVFASMFGISMALGPVLGGFLVSAISWRAIFVVTVPFGLAAIALTALFVPESRAPRPRRIDPVGQVLVIAALATLTYAIIEGERVGFRAAGIVALLALALGCFATLVLYEL